jgi:hypothetical protein
MKLKEFLEIVQLSQPEDNLLMDNQLYGKNLEKYKEIIFKTDEFNECESLDILEYPLSKSKDGKVLTPYTVKLSDVMKFKGRCYLLSLTLTPEMYDPTLMLKPVKDGAAIGPTVYDPITFEPKRQILLSFNPSVHFNFKNPFEHSEEFKRDEIHQLLDKVLDNFDEYKIKGNKEVLVRGLFEVVDNGGQVTTNTYDVDLLKQNPEEVGYLAYYIEENVVSPGEIKLEIKKKLIPPHLKDAFILEVGTEPAKITEKMIDNFLEFNNVPKPFDNNRLRDMLAKNKDVEDRISKIEKHDSKVKQMIKESKYGK